MNIRIYKIQKWLIVNLQSVHRAFFPIFGIFCNVGLKEQKYASFEGVEKGLTHSILT